MNILHLTTHLNTGGITAYILRLVSQFQKQGIKVHVGSAGGELEHRFKEKGCSLLNLNIRTKSELDPKLWFALPQIKRYIKENNIDLIHAHTRITQVTAQRIKNSLKIPFVTTCHGFFKKRLGRMLNPAWGDRSIVISRLVGEDLANLHGVSNDRIEVVHNGIDFEEIDLLYEQKNTQACRERFGFSADDVVLGVVARLVDDKGHDLLIQALEKLSGDFPHLKLLIVGEGRSEARLKELAKKLGVESRVCFAGTLSDVTEGLAAMDYFTFVPTWREGFGLNILEAMACRKPIFVSDCWALNTLVRHQKTGYLVKHNSLDAVVEGLPELLKNSNLCDSMVREARQEAETFYPVSKMANDIVDVYRDVLGRTA